MLIISCLIFAEAGEREEVVKEVAESGRFFVRVEVTFADAGVDASASFVARDVSPWGILVVSAGLEDPNRIILPAGGWGGGGGIEERRRASTEADVIAVEELFSVGRAAAFRFVGAGLEEIEVVEIGLAVVDVDLDVADGLEGAGVVGFVEISFVGTGGFDRSESTMEEVIAVDVTGVVVGLRVATGLGVALGVMLRISSTAVDVIAVEGADCLGVTLVSGCLGEGSDFLEGGAGLGGCEGGGVGLC